MTHAAAAQMLYNLLTQHQPRDVLFHLQPLLRRTLRFMVLRSCQHPCKHRGHRRLQRHLRAEQAHYPHAEFIKLVVYSVRRDDATASLHRPQNRQLGLSYIATATASSWITSFHQRQLRPHQKRMDAAGCDHEPILGRTCDLAMLQLKSGSS